MSAPDEYTRAAAAKNTNALTVMKQKRKAKSIAKKAAAKKDQLGRMNTTGIDTRMQGLSETQEEYGKRRLRDAKKGRKAHMDAGRIRKAAAKIK